MSTINLYIGVAYAREYYSSYLHTCSTDITKVQKKLQMWQDEEHENGCDASFKIVDIEVTKEFIDDLAIVQKYNSVGIRLGFDVISLPEQAPERSEDIFGDIYHPVSYIESVISLSDISSENSYQCDYVI